MRRELVGRSRALSDVCELIVDCEHKTAPTQEEGYPSIRTPNVGRGRLILEGVNMVSEETYRLWTRRAIPQKNDLILAREAPIGNVAIVPDKIKVCLGQRTVLIRPDETKIDPGYLVNLLLADEIQSKIQSMANGATVGHLNVKDIRELALPDLPPLPVQHKIASILSSYDDLIENNTRRIKIFEEMASVIFREWFVEFRGPGVELRKATPEEQKMTGKDKFPKGWGVKKLGEFVSVDKGISYKGSGLTPDGKPMVNLKNIMPGGGFRRDATKPYSGDHKPRHVVRERDIVLANTDLTQAGNVVGSPALIPQIRDNEALFSHHLYAIRFNKNSELGAFFTYHLLLTHQFKAFARGIASGTTVLGMPKEAVLNFLFVKPSVPLVTRFDETVVSFYGLMDSLNKTNDILRQTRDLLLPKLFSDELNVENIDITC
jgi:type I restriction enzyme S subunit